MWEWAFLPFIFTFMGALGLFGKCCRTCPLRGFAHFFPHPSDDEPFHQRWWMYLVWPVSAVIALVVSLLIKPLGIKPFIVVDRWAILRHIPLLLLLTLLLLLLILLLLVLLLLLLLLLLLPLEEPHWYWHPSFVPILWPSAGTSIVRGVTTPFIHRLVNVWLRYRMRCTSLMLSRPVVACCCCCCCCSSSSSSSSSYYCLCWLIMSLLLHIIPSGLEHLLPGMAG